MDEQFKQEPNWTHTDKAPDTTQSESMPDDVITSDPMQRAPDIKSPLGHTGEHENTTAAGQINESDPDYVAPPAKKPAAKKGKEVEPHNFLPDENNSCKTCGGNEHTEIHGFSD